MRIRCDGCGRAFAPSGLSQHLSKTRDLRCRRSLVQSDPASVSLSDRRVLDVDAPAPIRVSQDLRNANLVQTRDANTDSNGPALHEVRNRPHTSGANACEIAVDDILEDDVAEPDPTIEFESSFTDTSSVVVEAFPFGNPGAALPGPHTPNRATQGDSDWAPFQSQRDWDMARWLKTHNITSTAAAELLAMEVPDGLSYHTVKQLNDFIDHQLPGRPNFQRQEVTIRQETLEFYYRDTLACIRSLFRDPQYAQVLAFAPERHFTSHERKSRLYHEMYACDWWWSNQEILELRQPGATIIPVIISSDKTQLTVFREVQAYPIYMTIGNIPKDLRRKPSQMAQILLGYIPTSKLHGLGNKAARRRALANLFHGCMSVVLKSIIVPGQSGVPLMSGDGVWRRCHPIFACFIGDYPEQTLVTCTYNGRCPKCIVAPELLGQLQTFPPRLQTLAMDTFVLADEEARTFHAACRNSGLKPIYHPFWESLPYTNIFSSITPDVLHQMLQGVMKRLLGWLVSIFGATEIDARCRAIPPNYSIKIFAKGITTLSHVSGHEHKKMCCILLGLIVDLPIPGGRDSTRLVRSARALLDFLYLAQYQCHTSDTLDRMHDALSAFHNNKDIFVDLEVRDHFNIPKVHSLTHYVPSIRLFGTTDNYNTEQTEHLHIDFAKDAYRATNRKDIYSQMTAWLQRREKIQLHKRIIDWRQREDLGPPPTGRIPEPPRVPTQMIKMALNPTKLETFDVLAWNYGAIDFQDELADFLARLNNPGVSAYTMRQRGADTLIPFRTIPVFHIIKFTKGGPSGEISDSAHAQPRKGNIPARFDTVIVHQDSPQDRGNKGVRIAQVRVAFQIPRRSMQDVAPSLDASPHLAYVEWFSQLASAPDPKHNMYKVTRTTTRDGRRSASIIAMDKILGSVHLLPRFGAGVAQEWNSSNVLEHCNVFYINPFADIDSYLRFM